MFHSTNQIYNSLMVFLLIWLVVSTPLKNMKVSWDDYSQYMEENVPDHQPYNSLIVFLLMIPYSLGRISINKTPGTSCRAASSLPQSHGNSRPSAPKFASLDPPGDDWRPKRNIRGRVHADVDGRNLLNKHWSCHLNIAFQCQFSKVVCMTSIRDRIGWRQIWNIGKLQEEIWRV